jgi:hypothetical protein
VCASNGNCQTLPLANFASVAFSAATATSSGRTRAIESGGWSVTRLELRQAPTGSAGARTPGQAAAGPSPLTVATPSATAGDGAFSVLFSQQPGGSEVPQGPTLPGFTGGTPE